MYRTHKEKQCVSQHFLEIFARKPRHFTKNFQTTSLVLTVRPSALFDQTKPFNIKREGLNALLQVQHQRRRTSLVLTGSRIWEHGNNTV